MQTAVFGFIQAKCFYTHPEQFPEFAGKKYALISIQEPDIGNGFIFTPNDVCVDVITELFSDVDQEMVERCERTGRTEGLHLNYVLFNCLMARRIIEFVDKHIKTNDVDYILIHCWAGISRSAAVAAALHKFYSGSDMIIFKSKLYSPNMLVYRVMLDNLYGIFGFIESDGHAINMTQYSEYTEEYIPTIPYLETNMREEKR